jgi:hypothetical protein
MEFGAVGKTFTKNTDRLAESKPQQHFFFRYFFPCLSSIDKGKRMATKWGRRSAVHTLETRYFWFGKKLFPCFIGGKRFSQNQKWPLWARCDLFLLFFFLDRTSSKKARGADISPRSVDLREIKIYLLKQRGTPGGL